MSQPQPELPPEFQRVADLLAQQPPEVRDLFRYALVLAMLDDEKARVIGSREAQGYTWLTIETHRDVSTHCARPRPPRATGNRPGIYRAATNLQALEAKEVCLQILF